MFPFHLECIKHVLSDNKQWNCIGLVHISAIARRIHYPNSLLLPEALSTFWTRKHAADDQFSACLKMTRNTSSYNNAPRNSTLQNEREKKTLSKFVSLKKHKTVRRNKTKSSQYHFGLLYSRICARHTSWKSNPKPMLQLHSAHFMARNTFCPEKKTTKRHTYTQCTLAQNAQ